MSESEIETSSAEDALHDVTVIIQGRTDPECLAHYSSKYGEKCIVSTWDDDGADPMGMRIVRSKKPKESGPQNANFQIVSTLAGLRESRTGWIIKVRGDEYFSNLEYAASEVKKGTKLLTLPIFFRPHDLFPFHPSDHLIAGTKRQLIMMYRSAIKRFGLKAWPWGELPEQLLGAAYLEAAEGTRRLTKEHMLKHFDILDLEKMKDYRVSWNGMGKRFYNNFHPATCGDGLPMIERMSEL